MAQLAERTLHRRAVEAVIWGIPAVSYDLMRQSMIRDARGGMNQILYWYRLADWKNQYLTPKPDTIYFMPFFSTKEAGPMVLEIPPAEEGAAILVCRVVMSTRLSGVSRRAAISTCRLNHVPDAEARKMLAGTSPSCG